MSLRLIAGCTRAVSPTLTRRGSWIKGGETASYMSSSSKKAPPKEKKTHKTAGDEDGSSTAGIECGPNAAKAFEEHAEKGDTYKAGESFFSYNSYSFYDLENEMRAKRLRQPNSGDKAS